MNFWQKIPRPIIALSPMDGVTDAPFRFITAKFGPPDLHLTEFTNVEGLARNAAVMLDDFLYSEIERPVIAQIYGSEPESFYKIAIVVCELGFDGIDINMGCPAKKVASRGCGAGLILNPPLAKQIIREVKQGIQDWCNGKSLQDLGLHPRMERRVRKMNRERVGREEMIERKLIPVSVKTRLGFDKVVIEDWVRHLLEEEPAAISIHGRTLKQMYKGEADWEAIARAAAIIRKTQTLALGNGDLISLEGILQKIRLSDVDGVLVGRGALGNPWIFSWKEKIKSSVQEKQNLVGPQPSVDLGTRFKVLLEHSKYFEQVKGGQRFPAMRKHFGWYCKGLPQAAELRNRLCRTCNSGDVETILQEYLCKSSLPQIRLAAGNS